MNVNDFFYSCSLKLKLKVNIVMFIVIKKKGNSKEMNVYLMVVKNN